VFEIGCGIGTNLTNIFSIFGKLGAEVGGTDEDPRAVEIARKNCPFARDIEVGTADDIFFSDKSIDIIITDATLMYVKNINKAIKEMATVSRNGVVLCELYSPSAFKRIKLRLKGFYAHDYKRLLEKNDFYDIQMTKIKDWPDSLWAEYGYIISAKI
jgi:ubiquinone/menaquinone biosynthesis C-methylase UbiE